MNIVNETAFERIITADPAEIEKILQENGNATAARTIVLRNLDGAAAGGTPIAGQVFSVSKELNQGNVTFSFVCAEDKAACEKRVEELNSNGGFIRALPADGSLGTGQGITVIEGAPGEPVRVMEGDVEPGNAIRVNSGALPAAAPGAGQ
jgi:hypothetical protein